MRPSFFIFHFSFSIALLAGCDYVEKRVTDGERADRLYQAAMGEYAAGKLDEAIGYLEKVLKGNPGNASARFQLACLLQDHRKDPMGAICNYREYMTLFPNGDKVKIAQERMAACERQLATELVRKYNLGGIAAQDEVIARLRTDNAKQGTELNETKKALDKARSDIDALRRENDRIRRMVLAGAEDGAQIPAAAPSAIRKPITDVPNEKELMEDDGSDVTDRVKFSSDVENLIAEEQDETSQKAPFGKTERKQDETATAVEPVGPTHEPRPKTYIVQEGDTLFKLAIRFYGKRSAWTAIRDANKATVSSDGRIKAGQTLNLP